MRLRPWLSGPLSSRYVALTARPYISSTSVGCRASPVPVMGLTVRTGGLPRLADGLRKPLLIPKNHVAAVMPVQHPPGLRGLRRAPRQAKRLCVCTTASL